MSTPKPDKTVIERHHIDIIPENERHDRVRNQFTLWLGGNFNVFNLVLGGVVVSLGMSFWWALIAIAVGAGIGALLIALHATQGPELGVPQMIQSRGQFGFYGASFLFVAVFILNFGFIAAQLAIQGQSMNAAIPAFPIVLWIPILTIPAIVIGIFGYRWVHSAAKITLVVVGITTAILFIKAVTYGALPSAQQSLSPPEPSVFLSGVALLVIDLLTFGPFVSDYSRYLPKDVKSAHVFSAIYFGNVFSTFIACAAGAYITALLPGGGAIGAAAKIGGPWVLIIFALSLVNAGTFNAYTGGMQILSFISMFKTPRRSALIRILPFLLTLLLGTVVAMLGYDNFVDNLSNFLDLLLAIFIPWSAVNLTDYFVVRRGSYDVRGFFTPDSPYGGVAWRGMVPYLIGLGAEIPFVAQDYYTGPVAKALGGVDISWLTGFVVAAVVYWVVMKVSSNTDPVPSQSPEFGGDRDGLIQ